MSEDPGPLTSSYALLNETLGKKTFQITVIPSIRKKITPIISVKHPSHGLKRKFLSTTKPNVSLEQNIKLDFILTLRVLLLLYVLLTQQKRRLDEPPKKFEFLRRWKSYPRSR